MKLIKDRTAVQENYPALLHFIKANSCVRASASFNVSTSAAVHSRKCVPASVCMSVPRERVMRTTGACLKNQGSLTEKRAKAPSLPWVGEKQSSSSASQCYNLQAHIASGLSHVPPHQHPNPSPLQALRPSEIEGKEVRLVTGEKVPWFHIVFPPPHDEINVSFLY